MKYSDNNTKKILKKHQTKLDYEWDNSPLIVNKWNPSNRAEKRKLKKDFEKFRFKMSINNRIWYDSITDEQRLNVYRNYDGNYYSLKHFKEKYPGDLAIQRDIKLNLLC